MRTNRYLARGLAWAATIALAMILLGGCKTDTTPIKTLLDDPAP